jgi:hypothetical protein
LLKDSNEVISQIKDDKLNILDKKVKEINGDHYAEQFNDTIINLFNKHINDEFNEYQILIEALHTLIDSDYKDCIIEDYNRRIIKLEADNKKLTNKINILEKDNIKLKEDNIKLTNKVNLLEQDNQIMKNNKNKFDALVKLHECNSILF